MNQERSAVQNYPEIQNTLGIHKNHPLGFLISGTTARSGPGLPHS
jgi:hypothetical protein